MSKKIGRNDPCPCGSGKKYKKCCWSHTPSIEFVEPNESSDVSNRLLEKMMNREITSDGSVCDFCQKNIKPGTSTGGNVFDGTFCSIECETAMLLATDLLFMGSSAALMEHMRDVHCLTKDEVRIGIDRIFEAGDDFLCGALIDWEDHF